MNYYEKAVQTLKDGNYTCVICGKNVEYTSVMRGVQPLLTPYEEGRRFAGCAAADRVVGKAAAFLYVLLGVERVYAGIVSKPAKEVFEAHGVELSFDTLTELIENRAKTGLCPMESAVMGIEDPSEAPERIKAVLAKLKAGK